MRINGKQLSPNEEVLVLPRSDGDIVIKARGVSSSAGFDKICKPPIAPEVVKADSTRFRNVEDPTYKAALDQYSTNRTCWLILESLKATEGLQWEKVTSDPSTWYLWEQELKESGFSEAEVYRITNLVMSANSLDDGKLNAARKRFLASQAVQSKG